MYFKHFTVFLLLTLLILFSCKENQAGENESAESTQTESAAPAQNQQKTQNFQALPDVIFKQVYFESDYTDVIFENLPFSLSQDNNGAIRQLMNYVDNKPPAFLSGQCPLFAQQVLLKNGEIILEADIFHSEGCYYYAFRHQGNLYYNAMRDSGIQFYNNLKNQRY